MALYTAWSQRVLATGGRYGPRRHSLGRFSLTGPRSLLHIVVTASLWVLLYEGGGETSFPEVTCALRCGHPAPHPGPWAAGPHLCVAPCMANLRNLLPPVTAPGPQFRSHLPRGRLWVESVTLLPSSVHPPPGDSIERHW